METAAARETAHQGQVGLGRTDTCLRKQHPTHAEEELGLHQYNTHHLVHSDSCFVDVNEGPTILHLLWISHHPTEALLNSPNQLRKCARIYFRICSLPSLSCLSKWIVVTSTKWPALAGG